MGDQNPSPTRTRLPTTGDTCSESAPDICPALEAAVDLDDRETRRSLAAVFDRVEERLGQR